MPNLKELFAQTAERTTLSTSYLTDANSQIEVTIIIGDVGQSGLSEVWLDDEIIQEGVQGSFGYSNGSNTLLGHKLNIYTIVTDTSRVTNYTEVGLHIKGGISNFYNRLHKQVGQEGESVLYENEIFFFS